VWWDLRIIGEADGALKYATRDDLIREKARQEALERAGWLVIRWNWAEAVTDPRIMIRRIERAIERRRMHPPLFQRPRMAFEIGPPAEVETRPFGRHGCPNASAVLGSCSGSVRTAVVG
jgi:hypothetical protein